MFVFVLQVLRRVREIFVLRGTQGHDGEALKHTGKVTASPSSPAMLNPPACSLLPRSFPAPRSRWSRSTSPSVG